MKRIFEHPQPTQTELTGPKYWRSLDEIADTPDFRHWLEQEFPRGAAELDNVSNGMDRRHFLKIMAASFGLAGLGLTGCRQPRQHILPYAQQPERVVPGVSTYFASSFPDTLDNIPLIVETHENRPTKIEGNPSYKDYRGATHVFAQASILDLYDPDRASHSVDIKTQKYLSSAEIKDTLQNTYKHYLPQKGKGLAILLEPSTSPSRNRLIKDIQDTLPKAIIAEYTPIHAKNTEYTLSALYDQPTRPIYHFEKALRVLSFDSDFLHSEPRHLQHAQAFTKLRKLKDATQTHQMNRLYAIESQFSLTGGMADHRLRLETHHIPFIAARIAAEILKRTGGNSTLISSLMAKSEGIPIENDWVEACVKDLVSHTQQSLVIAGSSLGQEVHAIVALINHQLQAIGNTISLITPPAQSKTTSLDVLAKAIQKDQVSTLVIIGGNPVYNAPKDLEWASLQQKVPQILRFGYYIDETSQLATTHIAASHYLESWSDGYTYDGTYLPVQPMILPLFETLSELEFLGFFQGQLLDSYQYAFETFNTLYPQYPFTKVLAEGLAPKQSAVYQGKWNAQSFNTIVNKHAFTQHIFSVNNVEVKLIPSSQVGDGRYANNGWLQELPESMTKLCWDNAILISPRLAQHLQDSTGLPILAPHTFLNKKDQLSSTLNNFSIGQEKAFLAQLTIDNRQIQGPLHIHPGLANHTVIVSLGYGRKHAGRIGNNVGFDAYTLLNQEGNLCQANGKLHVLNQQVSIANTQQHWSMEGRALIREANAQSYLTNPNFVNEIGIESHTPSVYGTSQNLSLAEKSSQIPRGGSMFESPPLTGPQQWGMVIDLNSCTGCNACVIACQSENNIPIVGKEQVLRGREMHWIRIDRYFATAQQSKTALPEDPQVSFMGMLCQHCELAPCETVCPVNATVHDDQGLNVMAYNRCVGTRYCANNCPYKVRRFNFFDWNKRDIHHLYEGPMGPSGVPETLKMQKNPNVTVRMRGVMEKCTYCVQRIEEAKIIQRNKAKDSDDIKVKDGFIKTACQQSCPTEAIVFGDIKDPDTQVSKLKALDRNYSVLGYLNTRPRTTYLGRIRNPNPEMPDYLDQPLSRVEYDYMHGHHSHSNAHHS